MEFYRKLRIGLFFLIIFASTQEGFAISEYNPLIKIDGSNTTLMSWQTVDPTTGNYYIQGSYGNTKPATINISDPTVTNATNPIMASSAFDSASVRGVIVWGSTDLYSSLLSINVALASSGGWDTPPVKVSTIDDTILPNHDYKLSISPDGSIIGIIWSALLTSTNDTVIRSALSADGGNTWVGG